MLNSYFKNNLSATRDTHAKNAFYGWLGNSILGWTEFNLRRRLGLTSKSIPENETEILAILNHYMNPQNQLLNQLKDNINLLLGFHDKEPRVNLGPCGVFAQLFFEAWKKALKEKVHICFVMTRDKSQCYHIVLRLPTGELYDGGIGIHTDSMYTPKYVIDDMFTYDAKLLDKWAYGLERNYPRFCPNFDKNKINHLIHQTIQQLLI
jgi:hypothetical protein